MPCHLLIPTGRNHKVLSQDIWVVIGEVVCCSPKLVQSISEGHVHRDNPARWMNNVEKPSNWRMKLSISPCNCSINQRVNISKKGVQEFYFNSKAQNSFYTADATFSTNQTYDTHAIALCHFR
ncbi:hypothetical protein TNCV_4228691 [Trichonephila clavipes]|nr:hypothetical protein TNCV_4228691 [Trichonephila clavipes]